jgi:hypothetical protein
MAARGSRGGAKRSAAPQANVSAEEWFANSNRSQYDVGHWELSGDAFADAILGLLGDSIGVMFTRGSGGSAVGVVIMQGEKPWPREYYHEAEDLEDALRHIAGRTTRKRPQGLKLAE